MGDAAFQDAARQLQPGETLRLNDVRLDIDQEPVTLTLQRFEVFAPDARIVVHGPGGEETLLPRPQNVYLSGGVAGDPLSRTMLTVLADGSVRGLSSRLGRYWVIAGGERAGVPADAGLFAREIEPEELAAETADYQCRTDNLPGREEPETARVADGPSFANRGAFSVAYRARVAIESDYEYYARFGNAQDATDYAGDLIAYTSVIYEREIDTALTISHLSLWSTPADPWAQSNTTCGLYEFGRYWNNNQGGVTRTIAHFLSGKNNNGGVAWVGVLCRGAFNASTSGCSLSGSGPVGGAYGYSGDLDGNFDINNPRSVWDIVVVSHEIGHNFNSPHTMCYAGLGGSASHIDVCADQCSNSSCHCGANSYPTNCPGSGLGCGTIMSYCHFLGGGLSNIALTLGLDHPYGIEPERVPQRMNAHVVSVHAGNPSCLTIQPTTAWTQYLSQWPNQASILDMVAVFLPTRLAGP